jgi:hypothetical protein
MGDENIAIVKGRIKIELDLGNKIAGGHQFCQLEKNDGQRITESAYLEGLCTQ